MCKFIVIFLLTIFSYANHAKEFAVMAPLTLNHSSEWEEFNRQLKKYKEIGVESVSTDIWWGLVEKNDDVFDWSIFQKMSDYIIRNGLKWTPIFSFHRCGGNVGDNCNIPIPSWIWKKYIGKHPNIVNENSLKFKSEQGNYNSETISVWGTIYILDEYKKFTKSFYKAFRNKAQYISEISITLGPATELRYPSYNNHDTNTDYPEMGALQCYSRIAVESFKLFTKKRYGSIKNALIKWNMSDFKLPSGIHEHIHRYSHTLYGRDFINWYQESLFKHGMRVVMAIHKELSLDELFSKIPFGIRVPGIHWRVGVSTPHNQIQFYDRAAEISAGLINSNTDDWNAKNDFGYKRIFTFFETLKNKLQNRLLIVHYTAIEMSDGQDGEKAKSLAKTLTHIIAKGAKKRGLYLKGENALSENLINPKSWKNIEEALREGYNGVNILRMNHLDRTKQGVYFYSKLIEIFR